MTKQNLIDEINRLLVNNDIGFLRVNNSRVKIIDLNAILNHFKHQSMFKETKIALLFTIDEYPLFFRIKTKGDDKK